MDTSSNLKDHFKTLVQLDNGTYYGVTDDGTEMYIPKDMGASVSIYGYLPGQGGSTLNAEPLREKMEGDNPPDCLVVISPSCVDTNDFMNQAYDVITDSGAKVDAAVMDCFSAGCQTGIKSFDKFIGEHPELGDSSALMLTDFNIEITKHDDYSALRENQVPVFYCSATNCGSLAVNKTKALTNIGLNAVGVKSMANGSHTEINRDYLASDLALYLMRKKDDLNYTHVDGTGKVEYEFSIYNPENNSSPKILSTSKGHDLSVLEKYRANVDSIGADNAMSIDGDLPNEYDFSKYSTQDGFKIVEIDSDVASKFRNSLTNLEVLAIDFSKASEGFDSTIKSDLSYVNSSVGTIRGKISKSSFLTGLKTMGFRSAGGIPGIIPGEINRYFAAVGDTLTNLEQETKAIIGIAQLWVEGDKDLEKKAEEIMNASNPGGAEDYSGTNVPSTGTEPAPSPKSPSKPSPSPANPPAQEPSSEQPKDESTASGAGTNVDASKFTDSAGKTPTGSSTEEAPSSSKAPETPKQPPATPEEPKEKSTVVVDDDKITQPSEDGGNLILDYDNDTVNSLKYSYEFRNEAEAQKAINGLLGKFNSDDLIDRFEIDGKKIEIIFKDKYIKNINFKEVLKIIDENKYNKDFDLISTLKKYLK